MSAGHLPPLALNSCSLTKRSEVIRAYRLQPDTFLRCRASSAMTELRVQGRLGCRAWGFQLYEGASQGLGSAGEVYKLTGSGGFGSGATKVTLFVVLSLPWNRRWMQKILQHLRSPTIVFGCRLYFLPSGVQASLQ